MTILNIPAIAIAVLKRTDNNLVYQYVNDTLSSLYGLQPDEIIGKSLNFAGDLSLPTLQFITNFINSDSTFDCKHLETTNLPLCLLAYKLDSEQVLLVGIDNCYKLEILTRAINLMSDPIVIYYNKEIFYANNAFNDLYAKYEADINFAPNKYFRLGNDIYQIHRIKTALNDSTYIIHVYRNVTLEMNLTSELESQVNARTSELDKEIQQRREIEARLKALIAILPTAANNNTAITKVTTQPLNNLETEVLVRKLEGDVERISRTLYYNGTALTGRVLTLEGNVNEDRNRINEIEKKLEAFNNMLYLYSSLFKFFTSKTGLFTVLITIGLFFGFGAHQRIYQVYKQTIELLQSKD